MSTDTGHSDRKPSHRLFQVIGEGETARWNPIGAAWPNRDGKGFSIACDAVPLSGRMVLREIPEQEDRADEGS